MVPEPFPFPPSIASHLYSCRNNGIASVDSAILVKIRDKCFWTCCGSNKRSFKPRAQNRNAGSDPKIASATTEANKRNTIDLSIVGFTDLRVCVEKLLSSETLGWIQDCGNVFAVVRTGTRLLQCVPQCVVHPVQFLDTREQFWGKVFVNFGLRAPTVMVSADGTLLKARRVDFGNIRWRILDWIGFCAAGEAIVSSMRFPKSHSLQNGSSVLRNTIQPSHVMQRWQHLHHTTRICLWSPMGISVPGETTVEASLVHFRRKPFQKIDKLLQCSKVYLLVARDFIEES